MNIRPFSVSISVLVAIAGFLGKEAQSLMSKYDPDSGVSFEELVKTRGFNSETYQVITEDGYNLTLHRIVCPVSLNCQSRKPVILRHGAMQSSLDFVIGSPFLYSKESSQPNATTVNPKVNDYLGDNLGFDLALTKRYDVWVMNARGNMKTSKQHLNFTTDNPQFWEFSHEEMAIYDLPAVIDFVLQKTNRKSVGYVGVSEGATIALILLTMKPKYGDILQPVIGLGPLTFMENIRTPIRHLFSSTPSVCQSGGQFPLTGGVISQVGQMVCPYDYGMLCRNLIFAMDGYDPVHLNTSRLPVYLSYAPTPTSTRDLCHIYQYYASKRFARYDFGPEKNQKVYGQPTAPDYPVENISAEAKLAFFLGQNDLLSTEKDFSRFKKLLLDKSKVQLVKEYVIPELLWNHMDFVIGMGVGRIVYEPMIQVLDQHTKDE